MHAFETFCRRSSIGAHDRAATFAVAAAAIKRSLVAGFRFAIAAALLFASAAPSANQATPTRL
jgi:hypothetical protein